MRSSGEREEEAGDALVLTLLVSSSSNKETGISSTSFLGVGADLVPKPLPEVEDFLAGMLVHRTRRDEGDGATKAVDAFSVRRGRNRESSDGLMVVGSGMGASSSR